MPTYVKDAHIGYCPVQPRQIAAASRLYSEYLPGQARADSALASLAELVPDRTDRAVSLKMIAVHSLYGMRHRSIDAYADRIRDMREWSGDPRELVERLTGGHMYGGDDCDWWLASSFVHWFIDERMPIWDRWARRGLRLHYERMWRTGSVYRDFWVHLTMLRDNSDPSCSIRDFTRYLRLAGLRDRWVNSNTKRGLGIDRELSQLLQNAQPHVRRYLDRLGPQPQGVGSTGSHS